jgi:uncharacterized SAM-binding protein YcdF (DUF218 family)
MRAVERWRVDVAIRTLAKHGGGRLVVSGFGGEAERMAAIATDRGLAVVIEPTARTTRENVERSIRYLEAAPVIAIATDRFHGGVAEGYLAELRPDLAARLIRPERQWRRGTLIQLGGLAYAAVRLARRLRPG